MDAADIACLHTEVAPTNIEQLMHVKCIGSISQVCSCHIALSIDEVASTSGRIAATSA